MNRIFEEKILPEAKKMLRYAKIPQNAKVASTWETTYLDALKSKQYSVNSKDEIIVSDKDGKELINRHGWPMTAQDAIEETFDSYFERNNMPLTEKQYLERLKDKKISPAERVELVKFWEQR